MVKTSQTIPGRRLQLRVVFVQPPNGLIEFFAQASHALVKTRHLILSDEPQAADTERNQYRRRRALPPP